MCIVFVNSLIEIYFVLEIVISFHTPSPSLQIPIVLWKAFGSFCANIIIPQSQILQTHQTRFRKPNQNLDFAQMKVFGFLFI